MFYRRRLPHLYRDDLPVFLTWRLYGSLPPNRCFPAAGVTSGKAFAVLGRLLDRVSYRPVYLRRPAIADMVLEVIQHCADVLGRYTLHAFVVMRNHVHMLVSPHIPLPQLTKTLKSFTAKWANQ